MVYVGYPNKPKVDQGSVFTSKKWEERASSHEIEIQLSEIEIKLSDIASHDSIGVGERYHGPLRKIFNAIQNENQREDPEIILPYAIKGINDTMGENGIVPITFVYGWAPSFPFLSSRLSKQRDRMGILRTPTKEIATIVAERRVMKTLQSKLPSSTQNLIEPGDWEHVYREQSKCWEGPFVVSKVCRKQIYVEVQGM